MIKGKHEARTNAAATIADEVPLTTAPSVYKIAMREELLPAVDLQTATLNKNKKHRVSANSLLRRINLRKCTPRGGID